jgi:hypothetical protein
MTLSVRVPLRVEQELAEYCAKNKVSKSEAVNRALEEFLAAKKGTPSPYELGSDLFGPQTDDAPSEDIARHSKHLLRERVRGRSK